MAVTIRKTDNDIRVTKKTSTVTVNKNTTAAQFSSFTAAGDSGSSIITNNETLRFTGGTGITSIVSNDEVTLNINDEVLQNNDTVDGGTFI
jgi:hypothetical protein